MKRHHGAEAKPEADYVDSHRKSSTLAKNEGTSSTLAKNDRTSSTLAKNGGGKSTDGGEETREIDVYLVAMGAHQQYENVRKIAVVDVPLCGASLHFVRGELDRDATELMLPKDFRFLYKGAVCPSRKEKREIQGDIAIVSVEDGNGPPKRRRTGRK